MDKLKGILFCAVLVLLLLNNAVALPAEKKKKKDAVEIFEMDLETGEESTEYISVPEDESVLSFEPPLPEDITRDVIN